MNVSPTNSAKNLMVGEGVSGKLLFGDDTNARLLTVTDSLQIETGAEINAGSNALHGLTLSKGMLVDGTFVGYTSATQAINVTFDGNTATDLNGSGTTTFNKVTVNRTATLTIGMNLSVRDEFAITNTGRVDAGSTTITGVGTMNTFSMATGEFMIGGTNTFPGGFEVINLSGGKVTYGGLAQNIAYQDANGGVLNYYNLQIEESANGVYNKNIIGDTHIKGSLTLNGTTSKVDFRMNTFTLNIGGSFIKQGAVAYNYGTSTVNFNGSGFMSISADTARFYHLQVTGSGGQGTLVIGANGLNYVYGDFLVAGNTSVSTASRMIMGGNYEVQAGSSFTQIDQYITFNSSTKNQSVNVANSNFYLLYFDNGAPTYKKAVTGNINAGSQIRIYDDAWVEDAIVGQNHSTRSVIAAGQIDFKGSLVFKSYL